MKKAIVGLCLMMAPLGVNGSYAPPQGVSGLSQWVAEAMGEEPRDSDGLTVLVLPYDDESFSGGASLAWSGVTEGGKPIIGLRERKDGNLAELWATLAHELAHYYLADSDLCDEEARLRAEVFAYSVENQFRITYDVSPLSNEEFVRFVRLSVKEGVEECNAETTKH